LVKENLLKLLLFGFSFSLRIVFSQPSRNDKTKQEHFEDKKSQQEKEENLLLASCEAFERLFRAHIRLSIY
jgi:hypothetical protein